MPDILETLKARALLYQQVRAFFAQRKVLEVETPLLSSGIGTDPNLNPFEVDCQQAKRYLQTSPEFAMKRLLSEGSGSIFQISKAFRNGEVSTRHNPEFTMLEWYRVGFDEYALMDEVEDLLKQVLSIEPIIRLSYGELFQQYLNIDPYLATTKELEGLAKQHLSVSFSDEEKDVWLDLLFSHLIEPKLQAPTFIYHYPKSQAALAQITMNDDGVEVARRFELVVAGVEVANGYFELRDAKEQQERFNADQQIRKNKGLTEYPIDHFFIQALEKGLPECAGVALGLDRLLMLLMGVEGIDEVLPFGFEKI